MMRGSAANLSKIDLLKMARIVADHATSLGIGNAPRRSRRPVGHLGAVMADTVLQSGLNYRTVVYPRIMAILHHYPEAHSISGVRNVVKKGGVSDFLRWKHAVKISRFNSLFEYFESCNIIGYESLISSFNNIDFQTGLLNLHGVGPKTVDYLGCLIGIDGIAVDRHIRFFALEAGLQINDYTSLQLAFSYAADLLGIFRRDFDAWVWSTISLRKNDSRQMLLPL